MHRKRLEQLSIPPPLSPQSSDRRDRSDSDVGSSSSKPRARYNSVAAVVSSGRSAALATPSDYSRPQYKSPPRLTALADAPRVPGPSGPTVAVAAGAPEMSHALLAPLSPLSPFSRPAALAGSTVVRALSFVQSAADVRYAAMRRASSSTGKSSSDNETPSQSVPAPPLVGVELNPGPPKFECSDEDKQQQHSSIRAVLSAGKDAPSSSTSASIAARNGKKTHHLLALSKPQQPPATAPGDRTAVNAPRLTQRRLVARKDSSSQLQFHQPAAPKRKAFFRQRLLSIEQEIPATHQKLASKDFGASERKLRRFSSDAPIMTELPLSAIARDNPANPLTARDLTVLNVTARLRDLDTTIAKMPGDADG